jgi:GT2 family glycosyltransferase
MLNTIAVCIPCAYLHVIYLENCLNNINLQTLLPEQVVISISGVPDEHIEDTSTLMKFLKEKYTGFTLVYSITNGINYAGENRNIAVSLSNTDIICFLDADDLMRKDKLNIMQKIFSNNSHISGVIHKFYENVTPDEIHVRDYDIEKNKPYIFLEEQLHFGHVSFRRLIFEKFSYSKKKRGQDVEFIHNFIQEHLDNMVIYDDKLTYYMSNRSTYYSINHLRISDD